MFRITYPLMLFVLISAMSIPTLAQDVTLEATPHRESTCSDIFVAHTLEHVTTVDNLPIRMFESNGTGLAIGDLNNDGLDDIVLANLDAPETILWNEGDLSFRAESFDVPGRTRASVVVDLDADGYRDILFTSQRAAPSWWRNNGDETFSFEGLPGVANAAYSMNWGDLDGDGDLDLVTGSYDAELSMIMSNDFLFNGGAGVYYYENDGGSFEPTQLADAAQALAVFFTDMNDDGGWDIAVGNDFAELDRYWTRDGDNWTELNPFEVFTHSTMSFDAADLNNDGVQELFATDMHPYSEDEATMEAWQPVMDMMMDEPMIEGDPQVMMNTLQSIEDGVYRNTSATFGVDASGWSWSAKFGDLNSDGYLDLYIVNGMIAEELFGHLPNNELVEENQVYVNLDGAGFETAPQWGLNATASGRGMSMADLDGDGDLDIVVNNLTSAATLFENQLCGGDNLTISLSAPASANPDAIGASLTLLTPDASYQREITAASGYLSGDTTQVHFGLPPGKTVTGLEITWPDGRATQVDGADIQTNTHLKITRNNE